MSRSILLVLMILLVAASLSAQDGQQLRAAVDEWVRNSGEEPSAFRHAFTDLDGDGRPDALVLLRGSAWCGSGGCTLLVVRGTNAGFAFVSSIGIVYEPIRVLPEKTSGWKNLIVYVKNAGDEVIRFDGANYSQAGSGTKATPAQIKAAQTLMEPCCISLYTSEVRYGSFGEQGWVMLQDGQSVHVSFRDVGGLLRSDIEKWREGKRLLIIYSSDEGASVLDPESLKSVRILDGLKQHPIDVMAELNRFYAELMASLTPAQKQSVQTAQREWLQYRDAEKAAFDAVDNDGTLSRVSRAKEAMRVTKEQAERLARLLIR